MFIWVWKKLRSSPLKNYSVTTFHEKQNSWLTFLIAFLFHLVTMLNLLNKKRQEIPRWQSKLKVENNQYHGQKEKKQSTKHYEENWRWSDKNPTIHVLTCYYNYCNNRWYLELSFSNIKIYLKCCFFTAYYLTDIWLIACSHAWVHRFSL